MIKLLRNKDLIHSIIIQLIITIIFLVLFSQDVYPFYSAILFSISLLLTNMFFYVRRFKNIINLNDYLRTLQIDHNKSSIPFDQLLEGELAVLKNELYKLSVIREQQNQLLLKEKKQMSISLSDISHQLKTPLTSLVLLVDILSDSSLSEEKRNDVILQARKQTHKMKLLISVLLKMARLQSGEVKLQKSQVNVRDLLDQSLEPLHILQELNNVQVHYNISVDYLMCDLTWTSEAITNILKNAMEHSHPNTTIQIDVIKDTLGYCIGITNTGEVMSSNQLERIFDRFYKSPNGNPDSIGIGLSFAKQIIERQHGYIRATSNKNLTTFSIYLPFYSTESLNSHF